MRFISQKRYQIIFSLFLSFIVTYFIYPLFLNPKNINYSLIGSGKKIFFNKISALFTWNIGINGDGVAKDLDKKKDNSHSIAFKQVALILTSTPLPTDDLVPTVPNLYANDSPIPYSKPTGEPKPTKKSDVFPIDPLLTRPGKTTDEVFSIASKKTCVPKEVLKGIAYIESGKFFDVVSKKYFLLYNSYNWWNSEFLTEEKRICGGYGYDQNTGLVPNDSKFPGYRCKEGYGSGLSVMGTMSVSSYEQNKYSKKVTKLLGVKKTDRRVILDAIIMVGLISKDNVRPSSCNNWTARDAAKAACGYYGSCGFSDGTYYCNTFCRNYKKFGGKGDCQGAVNKMQDYCW